MANPRAEAEDKLGGDYEARVLEPSPPAVSEPPFADDPVDPGEVPEGRRLVSPIHNRGDLTWDEIALEEPGLASWCADRWLGAWKQLDPLPASFAETRVALHQVAEAVVAPARMPINEIALRYTRGGFGTPFFEQDGADCQVRVEHGELVRQRGSEETREPLPGVDAAAATALGDFYGLACSVLEQLRADETDGIRPWSSSGPSTSTSRSSSAPSRPGHGRTSAPRRAMTSTTSRTSTSGPGPRRSPASSGTRPASGAPSSLTPNCSRPTTTGAPPSTSCAPGIAPCRRASRP